MAKQPKITTVSENAFYNTTALNANFTNIAEHFEDFLSRLSETPNQMEADIDFNSNSAINLASIQTGSLYVGGVRVVADTDLTPVILDDDYVARFDTLSLANAAAIAGDLVDGDVVAVDKYDNNSQSVGMLAVVVSSATADSEKYDSSFTRMGLPNKAVTLRQMGIVVGTGQTSTIRTQNSTRLNALAFRVMEGELAVEDFSYQFVESDGMTFDNATDLSTRVPAGKFHANNTLFYTYGTGDALNLDLSARVHWFSFKALGLHCMSTNSGVCFKFDSETIAIDLFHFEVDTLYQTNRDARVFYVRVVRSDDETTFGAIIGGTIKITRIDVRAFSEATGESHNADFFVVETNQQLFNGVKIDILRFDCRFSATGRAIVLENNSDLVSTSMINFGPIFFETPQTTCIEVVSFNGITFENIHVYDNRKALLDDIIIFRKNDLGRACDNITVERYFRSGSFVTGTTDPVLGEYDPTLPLDRSVTKFDFSGDAGQVYLKHVDAGSNSARILADSFLGTLTDSPLATVVNANNRFSITNYNEFTTANLFTTTQEHARGQTLTISAGVLQAPTRLVGHHYVEDGNDTTITSLQPLVDLMIAYYDDLGYTRNGRELRLEPAALNNASKFKLDYEATGLKNVSGVGAKTGTLDVVPGEHITLMYDPSFELFSLAKG